MPSTTTQPVVLLYVHELLGAGLADHIRATTGVEVLAVPACEPLEVQAALARRPRVVIFERSAGIDEDVLAAIVRGATLIDVSDAVAPAGALVPEQGGAPRAETIVRIVDNAYALAGR
jgi:hypothetical protein